MYKNPNSNIMTRKEIKETEDLMMNKIKQQMEIFWSDILRTKATPPIKGKITEGKLKYRGIKYCTSHSINGALYYEWLEQRGKQIGDKIEINFKKGTAKTIP